MILIIVVDSVALLGNSEYFEKLSAYSENKKCFIKLNDTNSR